MDDSKPAAAEGKTNATTKESVEQGKHGREKERELDSGCSAVSLARPLIDRLCSQHHVPICFS